MDNFVVISGCSGGGKSTLLVALQERGHHSVTEPGRRIVVEELARGGTALPWVDPAAFARQAIRLSLEDRAAAMGRSGWVFFDRGLIDAASALEDMTGRPYVRRLARRHRSHRNVFMTPPWPEIYEKDDERRHDLADAIGEYERLCQTYPALGYEIHILPKTGVQERVDFVLARLSG